MSSSSVLKSGVLNNGEARRSVIAAMPRTTPARPVVIAADVERERFEAEERKARELSSELDRLKDRARADGMELARRQAQAEADAAVAASLRRLADLFDAVQQAWFGEQARAEALLAEFAFVAVNRLLADSLKDPAVAVAAVESALKACGAWQRLQVEVHPDDLVLLEARLGHRRPTGRAEIRFMADEGIDLGGCRIFGDQGTLDATLETQLAQLRSDLDAARRQWPPFKT